MYNKERGCSREEARTDVKRSWKEVDIDIKRRWKGVENGVKRQKLIE